MIDYKEIFEAWKASFKPNQQQEELAQKRLNVCLECDQRREVLKGVEWSAYCNDCGCPINKKIFSKHYNPCTREYWGEVDSEYMEPSPRKNTNTII